MALIKVTLRRSLAGRPSIERARAEGLGLRRIGNIVYLKDHAANRGALLHLSHLVTVNLDDSVVGQEMTSRGRRAEITGREHGTA